MTTSMLPPLALDDADPEIADLVAQERARQFYCAKLIPSENYASQAVLEAAGSVLANKYSEGYPRKRYYEGQQLIDPIEELAMSRAKALFGSDHANVQPYSGSPANLAVYCALLPQGAPNQRILALGLPAGGHLTHGHKVSATSRFFEFAHYGVDPVTHRFDFSAIAAQARDYRPAVLVAGCTAYPRIVEFDRFAEIAAEVGALLVADMAHIAGLVAGGAHPSPVPFAAAVSTTTHKTLRGPRGGMLLCKSAYAQAIDKAVFPGLQGGPHNHTTAAVAVALKEAAQPAFRAYAAQVVANARALADTLATEGLAVVTGGTDNHLVLFSTMPLGATGKQAAKAMDLAGLEANFNSIPFDPQPPMNPSGVRVGTPSLTSRGLGEAHMRDVGRWIARAIRGKDDPAELARIRGEVFDLMGHYPPPGFAPPYPARP
ncbi:MAG: serine hydroxymethyltransferase [Deltaproteobacteria bacterium]|nr:serine hydroxymethyltransferase [Deltaproteobacteria bacterium]